MDVLLRLTLVWLNFGLALGLIFAGMLLLRPLLVRVLSPQQRAVVWSLGWLMGLRPSFMSMALLPVTFLDLVTPRVSLTLQTPSYLPVEYLGDGPYHLALPGGALVRFELRAWMLWLLLAVMAAGAAVMLACCIRQTRALRRAAGLGWVLDAKDPLLKSVDEDIRERSTVYLCPGLDTSFVRRTLLGFEEIYLQEELPWERMDLILRHEIKHIQLWHTYWKLLATITLVLFWWNPLIWLAFRRFCLDLELACDQAVLGELEPERRREYAKTLVELGSGRQLWAAPTSFGECDGALRVKAAVAWKKRPWWVRLPTWLAALALFVFFMGVHSKNPPAQDMVLAWERETGSSQQLLEDLGREMVARHFGKRIANVSDEEAIRLTALWADQEEVLWAQGEDGCWYRIQYFWRGQSADWVGVSSYEKKEPPDLTGLRRLV